MAPHLLVRSQCQRLGPDGLVKEPKVCDNVACLFGTHEGNVHGITASRDHVAVRQVCGVSAGRGLVHSKAGGGMREATVREILPSPGRQDQHQWRGPHFYCHSLLRDVIQGGLECTCIMGEGNFRVGTIPCGKCSPAMTIVV